MTDEVEFQTDCERYDEHRGERLVYQDEDVREYECDEFGAAWSEEQHDDYMPPGQDKVQV